MNKNSKRHKLAVRKATIEAHGKPPQFVKPAAGKRAKVARGKEIKIRKPREEGNDVLIDAAKATAALARINHKLGGEVIVKKA